MQAPRRVALLLGLSVLAGAVHAQRFPDRPVRIVVPYAAGSGTDAVARAVAKALSDAAGVATFVDNKAGGEGVIGVQAVSSAAPDGYTLLLAGSSTQVANVHLFKKLPYDPVHDFTPVIPLARSAMLLTINADAPMKAVGDLMTLAREKPGTLTFGSGSSTTRLAGEFFVQQAGVRMLHVPYRSPSLAVTDLLGGQITMCFIDLPTISGHLQARKLRALAVSSRERMAALPDVPTLAESGLKDFDLSAWYGLWAPAGTPPAIVARLHDLFAKAATAPAVKDFYTRASMTALPPVSPAEFQRFQHDETAKIGRVIKAAGIEPQ